MKPKSEIMWMAWHPKKGFIYQTSATSQSGCKLLIKFYFMTSLRAIDKTIKPVKVQITEIQPKKRGKG